MKIRHRSKEYPKDRNNYTIKVKAKEAVTSLPLPPVPVVGYGSPAPKPSAVSEASLLGVTNEAA